MPRLVGYALNPVEKIIGGQGTAYNYLLAGNGVFIESKSAFLSARIRIAACEVRGLEPLEEKVELLNGPVPRSLYDLGLSTFLIPPVKERYVAVVWNNGGYHLKSPEQEGNPGQVQYEIIPDVVLDIHSHGEMSAWFSGGDDRDEQGFKLYMVVGKVDTRPEYRLRAGIYGYYKELSWEEVFTEWSTPLAIHSPKPAEEPGTVSWQDAAEPAASSRKGYAGFFRRLFRSYW